MKNIILVLSVLFILLCFVACGRAEQAPTVATEKEETAITENQTENEMTTTKTKTQIAQTGDTKSVPSEYTKACAKAGAVERLDYVSEDYAGNKEAITKTAYVYTPYGYNENDTDTRYDIIYLMHGWGGHAGEYFDYKGTKNVFDNLIANDDIPPVIIVSATFYNENSGSDFGSSVSELRAFHNDFENHLMPTVEGKYHTFAKSNSDEELKASRDHRAFGGFSLGSVTTWQIFCYDYDYV